MTLKEVFDQGACKVGNLIILEGGQHFLIGDATVHHSPSVNGTYFGWDGWLQKTVLFIFDLLNPESCAILEQHKARAALPTKDQENVTPTSQK